MAALDATGRSGLPVVVGGTDPALRRQGLQRAGVRAIFRGGERLDKIVDCFKELARPSVGAPSGSVSAG